MKKTIRIFGLLALIFTLIFAVACSSQDAAPEKKDEGQKIEEKEEQEEAKDEEEDKEEDEEEKKEEASKKPILGNGKGNKIVDDFIKLMSSDNYLVEYLSTDEEDGGIESGIKMVFARRGNDHVLGFASKDIDYYTILEKDGKVYHIDHENKTVLEIPEFDDDFAELFGDDPDEGLFDFVDSDEELIWLGSGKADFLGKEESFVDYKLEDEDDDEFMRLFHNDKELIGIEQDSELGRIAWIISRISKKADDKLFELPKDYALMGLGDF